MIPQQPVLQGRRGKGQQTREAILDAAEAEFGARGFDGASMRQITERARHPLGVLTYHFESKERLFETVVERRATEITTLRHNAMERLDQPTVEDLLSAFLHPLLDRIEQGAEGWRAYAHILADTAQDSRWAPLTSRIFGESARMFIRELRKAEGDLTLVTATRAYAQLIAVMVGLFASSDLLDRLSSGRLSGSDYRENCRSAIQFTAGGIRALAKDHGANGR